MNRGVKKDGDEAHTAQKDAARGGKTDGANKVLQQVVNGLRGRYKMLFFFTPPQIPREGAIIQIFVFSRTL